MFWKNWPYWLKGGTLFTSIIIVLMILTKIFAPDINCSGKGFCIDTPYWQYPLMVIFIIISLFLEKITGNGISLNIFLFPNNLLFLIFYFISGAIIAYIYGKIKNKNKN